MGAAPGLNERLTAAQPLMSPPADSPGLLRLRRAAPLRAARGYVIGVALILVMMTAMVLGLSRQHELERAQRMLLLGTELASRHVGVLLRQADSITAALAQEAERGAVPWRDDATLMDMALRLSVDAPQVLELRLVDAAGATVVHTLGGRQAEAAAQRADEAFRFHRASQTTATRLSPPRRSAASGRWVMPLSRRLSAPDGRFLGLVIADLDLAALGAVFDSARLGDGAAVGLVEQGGRLLLRQPFRPDVLGMVMDSRSFGLADLPVEGRSFEARSPVDGVHRLYNAVPLPAHHLVVIAGVDPQEVLAPWRRSALIHGSIVFLLVALLLALGQRLLGAITMQARIGGELQAANRRLRDMKLALDAHAEVLITDVGGRIVDVNDRFCHSTRAERAELIGLDHRVLRSGHHPPAFYRQLWRTIASGRVWSGEMMMRAFDGISYWMDTTIVPFLGPDGRPQQFIAIRYNISARKEAESALARTMQALAHSNHRLKTLVAHDALTGLASRREFDRALARELRRALRSHQPLALVLVDLDHFKRYNDHYGHPAGDSCLQAVARSLRASIQREGDLAARYGGEEFALLLPATDAAGATRVAERLLAEVEALALPHAASPAGIVTLSLGLAALQPTVASPDAAARLLQAADDALYQAKRAGRSRLVVGAAPALQAAAGSGS